MNDGEEKGRQRNERGRGRDGKEGRTGAGEVSNGKEAQGDSGGRCAGALGWKGGEREDLGNRGPKRIATRPPRSGPLELVTEFELFRARHQEFGAQQGTARFAGVARSRLCDTLYKPYTNGESRFNFPVHQVAGPRGANLRHKTAQEEPEIVIAKLRRRARKVKGIDRMHAVARNGIRNCRAHGVIEIADRGIDR